MANLTNCANPCVTCATIRAISGTTPVDVGYINENFKALQDQYKELCDLVARYLSASGIDADGSCITNVKNCPDDPNSVVPRSSLKQMIIDTVAEVKTCSGCQRVKSQCKCQNTSLLPNSN